MVCGDGEYIIYTAMALRNKSFGSAQEFVWSTDSSMYAVREGSTSVKIFKNFKEQKSFKPDFGAEGKERERERERNVLFNDTLNTFYLRLYGVRHMVKDHSDNEKGNPLPPHRLLLSINSKGSFICTIPQTG